MGGVTYRGIRHRPGRSAVVLVLAMVAVAAAVLAPAYTEAAQQSMLTDGLRALPVTTSTVVVSAEGKSGSPAYTAVEQARDAVDASLSGYPELDDILGPSVASVSAGGKLTEGSSNGSKPTSDGPELRLVYRDDVCAHLTLVEGACPASRGEVVLSTRSAQGEGVKVGDEVLVGGEHDRIALTVTGLYEPTDERDPYWGRNFYFQHGVLSDGTERLDALFAFTDDDVRAIGGTSVPLLAMFEYPLLSDRVDLAEVDGLVSDLSGWETVLILDDRELLTGLPGVFDDISVDATAIAESVPVVSIPLILLCWFVLFVVVANLTAGRGPEVALAKLRGHSRPATIYFGLSEALALILLAAPLGVLLGLGLVEATARYVLAEGTHVRFVGGIVWYAAVALVGAVMAAAFGAWRTLSLPVLDLLRRVPSRRGWRIGIVDGGLVTLSAAALFQAYRVRADGTDGSGPLVLLAPPLLALLIGVIAARLLITLARARLATAGGRGAVASLLTWAQLARRPAMRQVIVLVTVAVALLSFASIAWQIGEHNRNLAARDALGAERVYEVTAQDPGALMNAVNEIDPEGRFAMAVARSLSKYDQRDVALISVQSDRLATVGLWRGHDRAWLADLAAKLHPPGPEPLIVKGPLSVHLNVSTVDAGRPVRLFARVASPGDQPQNVRLGVLHEGEGTYTAELPSCANGCQLVGFGVSRFPGTSDEIDVDLNITGFTDGDTDLSPSLSDAQAWRRTADLPGEVSMRVTPSAKGLRVEARSTDPQDLIAEHGGIPAALPTIHAGPVPSDDPADLDFRFTGLNDRSQPFHVIGTDRIVPRGGTIALMTDLSYTTMQASSSASLAGVTTLHYEVWANASAPADLPERLAAHEVSVVDSDSFHEHLDDLGRKAPALALRLYLLAGAAAVLLSVGTVLFTTQAASASRGYEVAALRVAGVGRRVLRRSVSWEYTIVIGVPLLLGLCAGLAGAWLMLPTVPLVSAGGDTLPTDYDAAGPWLPVTVSVTVLGFAAAVWFAVRTLRRNGRAARLREGDL